jgi:hypothetical protein
LIFIGNRAYWPHGVGAGLKMQMERVVAARRDWFSVIQYDYEQLATFGFG